MDKTTISCWTADAILQTAGFGPDEFSRLNAWLGPRPITRLAVQEYIDANLPGLSHRGLIQHAYDPPTSISESDESTIRQLRARIASHEAAIDGMNRSLLALCSFYGQALISDLNANIND